MKQPIQSSMNSYSVACHQLKYEDAWAVDAAASAARPWAVYACFDGHNGDAARQLASALVPALEARMPTSPLGPERADVASYAEAVRRALVGAFLALHAELQHVEQPTAATALPPLGLDTHAARSGGGSGCTATVAVQTGRLLSVASVGNSRAVLDTGSYVMQLTKDHQLGACEEEDLRLRQAGAHVARLRFDATGPCGPGETGCGPLRIWPGGLRLSRSLGDWDTSPYVLPYPHIHQVLLPTRASRLILATDGVWNSFETHMKVASCIRGVSIANAASALLHRAASKRVQDDRTAVVVDLSHDSMSASFKNQHRLDRLSRMSSSSDGGASGSGSPSPSGAATGAATGIAARLFRSTSAVPSARRTAQLPHVPKPSSVRRAVSLSCIPSDSPVVMEADATTSLRPAGSVAGGAMLHSAMCRRSLSNPGATTSVGSSTIGSSSSMGGRASHLAMAAAMGSAASSPRTTGGCGSTASLVAAAEAAAAVRSPSPLSPLAAAAAAADARSAAQAVHSSGGRGGFFARLCCMAAPATRSAAPPRRHGGRRPVQYAISMGGSGGSRRGTRDALVRTSSGGGINSGHNSVGSSGHAGDEFAMLVADVDTFKAYAQGNYVPPHVLLPLIDAGGAAAVRALLCSAAAAPTAAMAMPAGGMAAQRLQRASSVGDLPGLPQAGELPSSGGSIPSLALTV